MNDRMKNSIYRLSTLVSLLEGADGITINRISQIMDVPMKLIYDDIISLKRDSSSTIVLLTVDTDYEDDFNLVNNTNEEELKEFSKKLTAGIFDDLLIVSHSTVPYERVGVVLSSEELELLQNYINKDISTERKRGTSYFIKNKSSIVDEDSVNKMLFIVDTMEAGLSMKIWYFNGKNLITKIIRPIKVINNTDDDLLYVFDHKGQFYRFDRIKKYESSKIKQEVSPRIDIGKINKMWGINYSGESTHIKLKIYDEGNVIERVKKDLGEKINPETFDEQSGFAIYEDDVIGIDSFLSWVYSYGSSMVILSPQKVVDRVMDSIKTRKEYYV